MNSSARSNTKYMEIPQTGRESSNVPDQSQPNGAISPDGKLADQSLVANENAALLPQNPSDAPQPPRTKTPLKPVPNPPAPAVLAQVEDKELDKILTKVENKEIIEKENIKKKLEKLKAKEGPQKQSLIPPTSQQV